MGGLATNSNGVGDGVGDTMADQDLGSSRGSSEDCSKANEGLKYARGQKSKESRFISLLLCVRGSPSFCSVQVFWID